MKKKNMNDYFRNNSIINYRNNNIVNSKFIDKIGPARIQPAKNKQINFSSRKIYFLSFLTTG